MRKELISLLRCPVCYEENLIFYITNENHIEIREGYIKCQDCGKSYEINNGIVNLLVNPSPEIINEQKGWTTLEKAVVNTDELMLSLPDAFGEHKPLWKSQAENFHMMFPRLNLNGTETVLDLGSGRCWSTRFLSRKGCYAVGLDILLTKYVGLFTSDIYIDRENIYFERVCGSMNTLPFRDQVFDLVFISATLHHSSNISITLKEVSRVLKIQGQVFIINEPVAGLTKSVKLDCTEIEMGINEHVYRLWKYLRELRRAGLRYRIYPYIGCYARIINLINRGLITIFPEQLFRKKICGLKVYAQLLFLGGVLNLIAYKPE